MEIIINHIKENWFNWLTLIIPAIVSSISIVFAYWLGERTYKRDKADKQKEETENIKSEKELFDDSLNTLKNDIEEQIDNLRNYIETQSLAIMLNPNIKIDFLKFINIKSLYKDNDRNKVNKLLSALYSISDFYTLLMREKGEYQRSYNNEEKIFQENYREVFYTQVNILNNKRAKEFKRENGKIFFKYNEEDYFMTEYIQIANSFEKNVKDINGLADRNKVAEELIKIINISHKYIPIDYDAITIHHLSNKANSAYANMNAITEVHFRAINSFITILENVKNEINSYYNKSI